MIAAPLIGLKFAFEFDPVRLKKDLDSIGSGEWSPHYNERDFGGRWQGSALRSAGGSVRDIDAGHAGANTFADTPLLARSAYFREVLSFFQCPLKSVRLLSLEPGSFIREHSDPALHFEEGEIRIHIPVRTHPQVEFYVCGERLQMEEGKCYYVNVNLPHRVNNRGTEARIHLVIDAVVNDWVRGEFLRGCDVPRCTNPPSGFDEFAQRVFADAAMRERLHAQTDRSELLRVAVDEARTLGFDFNTADIESAFRSRPAAAGEHDAGWIPIAVSAREALPSVRWIYAPQHRFTEPFFEDSIRVCLRNPFTKLFQREALLAPVKRHRPSGFIFHMSRCGSTLISRSLAAVESMHVISEAPPIDAMVQTGNPEWIEWIVSALGQGRRNYVVKLDAWHIRSFRAIRAAFPDVPWIFVYRDPLEVLVSHLRRPGLQASPGLMDASLLGMSNEDAAVLTRTEWCMRVIEGFMTAALSCRNQAGGLFVDYRELPGAVCGRIAAHFGLELNAEERDCVQAATQADAKNPWSAFESDSAAKQTESRALMTEEGREDLLRLASLYARLRSS